MHMSRLRSITAKAMAMAMVVLCLMVALQGWALLSTVRSELPRTWAAWQAEATQSAAAATRAKLRVGGMVLGTYAFATACAGLFAFYITRHRAARLARILRRIADGDLLAQLEPLLDTDLRVVREALARMQTALDELTNRLKHTDAQRRRLFADLAHELATPTSTILAIAAALASRNVAQCDEDRERFVSFLEQEATRLERLVTDVRDLARLDDPDTAIEQAPTDLAELVRRTAERMNAADVEAARITVVAKPAWAMADLGRMEQVLINLLTNARRYTPPDGLIAVATQGDGDEVLLVVEDSGVGVPDEMLPRLGERLLRLDPSRSVKTGGHGLGLSIVSAVVQRHQGRLRFERSALGGLRVVVAFAALADPSSITVK
jgi:signal transduction histidine kinase